MRRCDHWQRLQLSLLLDVISCKALDRFNPFGGIWCSHSLAETEGNYSLQMFRPHFIFLISLTILALLRLKTSKLHVFLSEAIWQHTTLHSFSWIKIWKSNRPITNYYPSFGQMHRLIQKQYWMLYNASKEWKNPSIGDQVWHVLMMVLAYRRCMDRTHRIMLDEKEIDRSNNEFFIDCLCALEWRNV
mgnify:CR=1 FL=1